MCDTNACSCSGPPLYIHTSGSARHPGTSHCLQRWLAESHHEKGVGGRGGRGWFSGLTGLRRIKKKRGATKPERVGSG